MKRGDVWWIEFEPAGGDMPAKEHSAVIVSNDAANKYLNRLHVVPLTTAVDRLDPNEAAVTLSGKRPKAMADQLTTVSKLRVQNRLGRLSKIDMNAVGQAITAQLGPTEVIKTSRPWA